MTDASVAPAPLHRPLYGASFGQAVSRFWRNYVNFSGRASRSEFWWAILFLEIFNLPLLILTFTLGGPHIDTTTGHFVWGAGYFVMTAISTLFSLAVLLPTLGVAWRRLHDTNHSGGLYFLVLIPLIGGIIVLVLLLSPSNPAGARFDRP